MTRNLIFIFALSVLLAACQERRDGAAVGALYNSELAHALQERQFFNKKRTTLMFETGATAQTCSEYLRLIAGSALKEDVNNQLAKGEYLSCEVVAMIGDKKLSVAGKDAQLGQALATRLDLRSFPSSLFQRLSEKMHSLSQLVGKAVKVGSTTVIYETPDWHYRLEVVATLDVNNNGKLDWVLWLSDEAKSGNYRQYQTLIIHDVSDNGPLRAVPYVVTMNAHRK